MRINKSVLISIFMSMAIVQLGMSQKMAKQSLLHLVDSVVKDGMSKGDIPGLSIVVFNGDEEIVRSYGISNASSNTPVTNQTLFQLGSCSKAFTALTILKLAGEGKVHLDSSVTEYIPWLHMYYKGKLANVTLRHLLHHTSRIPWNSISKIPLRQDDRAIAETVK